MEQRTDDGLSPYRTFSRTEWAALREDTPMTLTSDEVAKLRSLHDRLDISEVEDIYLPLSRLLSLYVAATQRLHRAEQRFLGTACATGPHRKHGQERPDGGTRDTPGQPDLPGSRLGGFTDGGAALVTEARRLGERRPAGMAVHAARI